MFFQSEEITGLLNGSVEPHIQHGDSDKTNKVPWVEELKLNQAKKNSVIAQGTLQLYSENWCSDMTNSGQSLLWLRAESVYTRMSYIGMQCNYIWNYYNKRNVEAVCNSHVVFNLSTELNLVITVHLDELFIQCI